MLCTLMKSVSDCWCLCVQSGIPDEMPTVTHGQKVNDREWVEDISQKLK